MAKKIITSFSMHKVALLSRFFIEEQRPNGKYVRIPQGAGPYPTYKAAEPVAKKYSMDNHVTTRIVGDV